MHSDNISTMAATSSTTKSVRASSSHDSMSASVINSMQSTIALHPPLPAASTIRSNSGMVLSTESSSGTPTTTIITIHDCGETVPEITHHHGHHQMHHHNGLGLSADQLRPHELLLAASPTSTMSHQTSSLVDSIIATSSSNQQNLKVIHVGAGSTQVSSHFSTSVIDDCMPSTTLSHSTLLIQSNSEAIIPTSPIATLSLESGGSGCPPLTMATSSKNPAARGVLFGGNGCSEDELGLDGVNQSSSVNSAIGENFSSNGVNNSVVQKSSCASTSTNSPTTSKTLQNCSEGSSSIDNINPSMSADSLSSESGDLDIMPLDEAEGYQDNTSSNSQQSAGGGSVSGGGGVISGSGGSGYIPLIPPPVGNSGGVATQCGEQIDFKHLFEELCPVCGDKVSGYHYGLLTCESCKGFFKRTVQNKKVYTCVAERSCHIDKTQRKRCPYCRFQKCLEVGMKLEAVRADRMRGGRNKFGPMYKRDRARKLQMMRQRQLALQAIRGSMGSTEIKPGQLSPTAGYQQTYPSMNIKQEIQIPQVSSLTQSPDSSPSPMAIALGQVNPSAAAIATSLSGNSGGGTNTTTVSGAGGGAGGGGCPQGSGSGTSLQETSDSKLCFDTGTNPSSTADSVSSEPLRVSPMIREFVQSIDDREWQAQLFTLLQKQSYNQCEVDLFELMCKVLDQNLFSQVDWARNTVFFKDLKVDDQMKLLQHSWSDMLVLDHLHQRLHNNLPDETPLHNGQIFNLLDLGLLGVPQLADYFNELQNKLQELKFDMGDYVCMKFLILLNPNVRGIINKKTVLEGHENVQAALLDYTLTCYPSVTDKFSRLLSILPEIHAMAARGEEHLYLKHCAGSAPTQTLLMEMLHAKRKV